MKNKLLNTTLLGVCLILTTSMFAQPSIPDISGVKQVSVGIACKLTLIQGEKASMTITGDKEALEDVEIKVIGDKLKIYTNENDRHKKEVYVTITLADLTELSIGGAVDVKSSGTLNFEDLTLKVSGVADFDLNLKSKVLVLDASGVISGDLTGETDDFKIEISGVGKFDATKFKAKNCKADVSGVARISVYASERLLASVSGMGKINYLGDPIINANSSGIGDTNKL